MASKIAEKAPGWVARVLLPEIAELKEELKNINTRIEDVNARIDAVNNRINEKDKSLFSKIDRMDKRLNSRIDSTNNSNQMVAAGSTTLAVVYTNLTGDQ